MGIGAKIKELVRDCNLRKMLGNEKMLPNLQDSFSVRNTAFLQTHSVLEEAVALRADIILIVLPD